MEMEFSVPTLFRKMIGKRVPTEHAQFVRVMIAGQYVNLTLPQARRYEELVRMGRFRQ